jgi:hypothetical protein
MVAECLTGCHRRHEAPAGAENRPYLLRKLVKCPGNASPRTTVGRFAWCNVRPTSPPTCMSMNSEWDIARTTVVRATEVRAFGLRGVDGEYAGEFGEAGFEVAS